jgi:AcrR family transcriptional regulator
MGEARGVTSRITEAQVGLRELKRRETEDRITRAARSLFRKRGFDLVTVGEIAAAAAVSRRTFFHYFASKEDVVFAWQDELETALGDASLIPHKGESLLQTAERAVIAAAGHFDRDEAVALSRLVRGSEVLRARNQVRYCRLEQLLAERLGERSIRLKPADLRIQLVAMVAIGALRIASENWLEQGSGESPQVYVRGVFRALWREAGLPLKTDRRGVGRVRKR